MADIKIGNWRFEIYKGCTGKTVYAINEVNTFGGSFGYADPSLLKVLSWWFKYFRRGK